MNLKFIKMDLILGIRSWLRSIGTVFWTILFPVLLIMMFGAIFSGADDVEYDLIIQNLDETDFSEEFVNLLKNNITIFKIDEISKNKNLAQYMLDNDKSVALQIPNDFGVTLQQYFIDKNVTVNLTFFFDPTDTSTVPIIRSIVTGVLNEFNDAITGSNNFIGLDEKSTIGEDYDFIDF